MLIKLHRAARVAVAALLAVYAFSGSAQTKEIWPTKPVRFVVPFAAGGSIDVLARLMSNHLAMRLGQSFIVENRTGAGGTVGTDAVAKAPADGYTLLFTAQGPLVLNPFLMKRLPYNIETAFAPVTVVVEAPNLLVANPQLPFSKLEELLLYFRSNPDKATYATQGVGTTGHITGELMNQQIGTNFIHVPYQGFPGALTDVTSGRVAMIIGDTINLVPYIRSGQLRPIAIASAKRSAILPEVPTFAEADYPAIVSGPWFAVLAPAGTPIDIRRELADEMRQILSQQELQNRLKELGVESRGLTPEEADIYMKAEYKRWGEVIRNSGITLN